MKGVHHTDSCEQLNTVAIVFMSRGSKNEMMRYLWKHILYMKNGHRCQDVTIFYINSVIDVALMSILLATRHFGQVSHTTKYRYFRSNINLILELPSVD